MSNSVSSLKLIIGPLKYKFKAYDHWGRWMLAGLQKHLNLACFNGVPRRILHAFSFGMTPHTHREIQSGSLPNRLARFLPVDSPRQGWQVFGDETGHLTWSHNSTHHTLWTHHDIPATSQGPFLLPWLPILMDVVGLGGGILHAGLMTREDSGILVTAPPGGGKTTALSRLPAPWRVMADDASLVWPGEDGTWRASPLPTWSVLLGRNQTLGTIGRWRLDASVRVTRIILLKAGTMEKLTANTQIEAVPHLYRAFIEHPRVIPNRTPYRNALFRAASALARSVPFAQLELRHTGDFWHLLAESADHA